MKRVIYSGVAAFLASASVAYAQHPAPPSPPPPPPPAAATEDEDTGEDDIVVVAEQGDQVRIDRRTYTLRDDATAQATNMFDVLGRIPSVSVAPSGAITLLGASNVTIQINGQPVPGANLEQVLRGLPGSDVERIEVITNPSAQYSAQAEGGIINIITRQRFNSGFNGSIQTGADSLGGYHAGFSPSYSRGPWSFSGQVGLYGGEQENDLLRVREDFPSGPITTEEGQRVFDFNGWYAGRLQASYRPNTRRRMSVTFDAGEFNFEQPQTSLLSDTSGPLLTQTAFADNSHSNNQLTFDFQQDGERPREQLRFSAAFNRFAGDFRSIYATTPAGGGLTTQYATATDQETRGANIKLDVERPLEHDRFLTFGAQFEASDQAIDNMLDVLAGSGPPEYAAALDGVQQTLSAYTTFQFETGDWTWLPGLRAESYRREVSSGGLETDTTDERLFPSLHIRRELTSNLNLDVSYSSRIRRPDFQQLDPALRYVDVNRATSGNPDLAPTTTDAYEANLVYQRNGASYSLTFYDRISDDIVSQFTDVTGGGVIVTRPVNAGTSEQRGVQMLLRGPIGENWRYSLTGNVLNREFDVLSGGVITRRDELEYDGIAQIEYRDSDQNAVGADHLQFELRFQGPRFGLQSEQDEFVMGNFTWRRRLAPKLTGVLMVQDIFDSTDQISEITTDDYFERTEYRGAGTRFRVALTYQFGSGPQRPLQDAPPTPGPPMP